MVTHSTNIAQAMLNMRSLIYFQGRTIASAMRMCPMASVFCSKAKVILHRSAQHSQAVDTVKHAYTPSQVIRLIVLNQEKATERSAHCLIPRFISRAIQRLDIMALEELKEKIWPFVR